MAVIICQQTIMHMWLNVHVIWLDKNVNDKSSNDPHNTLNVLCRFVDAITGFNDEQVCGQFIQNLYSEKSYIITSDLLAQYILLFIHNLL